VYTEALFKTRDFGIPLAVFLVLGTLMSLVPTLDNIAFFLINPALAVAGYGVLVFVLAILLRRWTTRKEL
jgi:membrane protein implicated in regulation of membrane protease activity